MSKVKFVFVAVLAFVLGLAFVGCGEDPAAPSGDTENFVGSWKLVAFEDESGAASSEDIELIDSLGVNIAVQLNDDMTSAIHVFGEVLAGTWTTKSSTELSVSIAGDRIEGALSGDELVLSDGLTKMTFAKMSEEDSEAMNSHSVPGGAPSARDDDFAPIVLADDEICSIKMVSKETDDWGDSGFVVEATNNSEKAIYVTADNDFVVDGSLVTFWGGEIVQPGETQNIFVYAESADVADLEVLVNVSGGIVVWDAETQDILASYPFTID